MKKKRTLKGKKQIRLFLSGKDVTVLEKINTLFTREMMEKTASLLSG